MGAVGALGRDIDTSSYLRAGAANGSDKRVVQGLLRYIARRQKPHGRGLLDGDRDFCRISVSFRATRYGDIVFYASLDASVARGDDL